MPPRLRRETGPSLAEFRAIVLNQDKRVEGFYQGDLVCDWLSPERKHGLNTGVEISLQVELINPVDICG